MPLKTFAAFALIAILGLFSARGEEPKPAPPILKTTHTDYDFPGIEKPSAWFVRKEVHGMTEADGKLLLDAKPVDLPATSAARVAGALYPRHNLLLTVQADGSADLYARNGAGWKLHSRIAPDVACRNQSVRLTIVPGLVYLLNYDVEKEKRLNSAIASQQDYADIYKRVCLTENSSSYHAIGLDSPDDMLLEAAYSEPLEKSIYLVTSERDYIQLDTGGKVAEPFRSGPGMDLAASVFVLRGQGIVALTDAGWSVSDFSGKLVQSFSTKQIVGSSWTRPAVKDGNVYVYLRNGPGGTNYRMDRESGKLVEDRGR